MMATRGIIYLAGPRGDKIRRALESTGLEVSYIELDAARSWFQRLGVLHNTIVNIWKQRYHTVAFMMDFIGNYSLVLWLVCRLLKVPFVIRLRGDMWRELGEAVDLAQSLREKIAYRWQLALVSVVISHADMTVPVSTYLKQRILEELPAIPPERVAPAPMFINLDRFQARPHDSSIREKLGLPVDALVVCTVTDFSYHDKARGLNSALDVLDPLMHVNARIHWLITGGGMYHAAFKGAILGRAQSRAQIHFLGESSNVALIYLASDLLVYFSFMDTFPNVVLEAQACGIPAVVNAFGGMPGQVIQGETGYVVDLSSLDQVRQLTKRLLFDVDRRRRMGAAARQFIESNFHYSVVGQQFATAFRALPVRN